jgi:hypothetical protein
LGSTRFSWDIFPLLLYCDDKNMSTGSTQQEPAHFVK